MIRIYRDDEYALKLEFDFTGATELKEMFKKSLHEGRAFIQISNSFLEDYKPINVFLVTNQGNPSELTYNDGEFILDIDPDIIEFCMDRFNESISKRGFFPAEICDVDYKDTELTIYGIVIGE
ncbi:hypothetical protein CEF21_07665 [Bacillus sp. FJAT-42376]|uniref:hypothetical protein n=1 Tax=Bacillus sp. FJAT-42376 TaxID=2014076 RepID=UPI000F515066|nr:hypothetical protein [Bacillus sp. FJAT-42376]AZB42173.1 hypothetical protein CEF21_07665 [Bacillus sp. FJAT-42376]